MPNRTKLPNIKLLNSPTSNLLMLSITWQEKWKMLACEQH